MWERFSSLEVLLFVYQVVCCATVDQCVRRHAAAPWTKLRVMEKCSRRGGRSHSSPNSNDLVTALPLDTVCDRCRRHVHRGVLLRKAFAKIVSLMSRGLCCPIHAAVKPVVPRQHQLYQAQQVRIHPGADAGCQNCSETNSRYIASPSAEISHT